MTNWNPNFDPYEELMTHAHNIEQLIKAYTSQSETMKELAHQHQSLAKLLRNQSRQIQMLEHELETLKSR